MNLCILTLPRQPWWICDQKIKVIAPNVSLPKCSIRNRREGKQYCSCVPLKTLKVNIAVWLPSLWHGCGNGLIHYLKRQWSIYFCFRYTMKIFLILHSRPRSSGISMAFLLIVIFRHSNTFPWTMTGMLIIHDARLWEASPTLDCITENCKAWC